MPQICTAFLFNHMLWGFASVDEVNDIWWIPGGTVQEHKPWMPSWKWQTRHCLYLLLELEEPAWSNNFAMFRYHKWFKAMRRIWQCFKASRKIWAMYECNAQDVRQDIAEYVKLEEEGPVAIKVSHHASTSAHLLLSSLFALALGIDLHWQKTLTRQYSSPQACILLYPSKNLWQ